MLTTSVKKANPISTGPNLIAGSATGVSGFSNDAVGSSARFSAPGGIVRDGSAVMYVADTNNHAIRKVTPAGVVTTFVGSGSAGFTNGNGVNATFSNPRAVSIDCNSNIYVADSGNNTVRKVTSGGSVTTLPFLVPGARALSVNSDGSIILAVDGGYGIHMYSNSTDVGTPFASSTYPNATGVAVTPDGGFYYFTAPAIFQPSIPTNIVTVYRVTFGSSNVVNLTSPTIFSGYSNGQSYVTFQYTSNHGLQVNDIFKIDSNAFANEGGGGLTAFNGYVGQVYAINLSGGYSISFIYTTDGSKGVYPIGTPNASAFVHSTNGSNDFSNIQAIQYSGGGNYSFIFTPGGTVPPVGSTISFSNGSNAFADWNGVNFQCAVSISNEFGRRISGYVTHPASAMPTGGSNGSTNGKVSATTSAVSSNVVDLNGVFYGAGGASGFFITSTQLFVAQPGCNIIGYSLSGDTGVINSTPNASGNYSNFVVKTVAGSEIFVSDATSNQIVSYSNIY